MRRRMGVQPAWLAGLTGLAVMACLLTGASAAEAAQPGSWPDRAEGFGQAATGGAGGEVVTVSTQEDLEQHASGDEPRVVRVDGSIRVQPFGREIPVGSNKSIIGVGTGGEIVEGGFRIIDQQNVIIRNLTIRDSNDPNDSCGDSNDYDGIQVDRSRDIWIDHNLLTRTGDGIIDLREDTDNVTVSWNVIAEGCKALGIGWTSNVVSKLTIHHNWFRDNASRNPSIDNVAAGHLYNNHWQNITSYGVLPRGGARVVVEGNYFQNVQHPYGDDGNHPDSELVARDNILVDVSGRQLARGAAFDPSSYYDYQRDPAAEVPDRVSSLAGPQPDIGVDDPLPPQGGCTAEYQVVNEWQGGFQAEATVTAGDSASNGWRVTWSFADGQIIDQHWNANLTTSGSDVTAENTGWNGNLAPGASTAFGFIATHSGDNRVPTLACTPT